ncbi:hypothetical protein GGS21DRAFT_494385 [Xylaria nigripes]|nr:hypothetical protein GGS21DRAFT_494385 [Xylaria nigripes]
MALYFFLIAFRGSRPITLSSLGKYAVFATTNLLAAGSSQADDNVHKVSSFKDQDEVVECNKIDKARLHEESVFLSRPFSRIVLD